MQTSLSTCRIDFAAFYFDGRDHAAWGLERQGCEPEAARAGLNKGIFRNAEWPNGSRLR